MDSTCTEKTDIRNNNIDTMTSNENISDNLDNGESFVGVDNRVNNQDSDCENENIRVEGTVVRRRKTDRKRASVRTKLWRKSMMERSVLPPPPLPPDPSQPDGVDNNIMLSENNRACPENISVSSEDYIISAMADKTVLSTKVSPQDETRVSPTISPDIKISSSNTSTLSKDTQISKMAEISETVSPINQEISTPLDNKQPPPISNEKKWISRKRLSFIKRQSLPPPPVPPNSTC